MTLKLKVCSALDPCYKYLTHTNFQPGCKTLVAMLISSTHPPVATAVDDGGVILQR